MRILALDWGTVRIGAAISDEGGKIAFPFEKFIDGKDFISEIKTIIEDRQIEKILLGIPMSLAGQETSSTKAAKHFGEALARAFQIPIEYFDERFSSKTAANMLSAQGLNQKQQRGEVDNLAAQTMLQTYLDTKNN
ncbi:MAG: Holliday junction resolvase RuvX [Candidatus Doudnabacteria bacterium]|nr:Holliday junction resolvase RuvX [Candidatus Doudnabacteria bacterium]